jgi:hypothetical protein
MKKKLLSILTVLLILTVAIGIVACSDYTEPTDSTDTSTRTFTHTVTNGTFYSASTTSTDTSGDTALLDTITGWTQTSGSTTTSKTGTDGVMSSVIDISDEATFDAIADKYFKISVDDDGNELETPLKMSYPGLDAANIPQVDKLDSDGNIVYQDGKAVKINEDTNVLAIASTETEGSLYVKGSSSYTLDAASYYMLQFSVCTMIDADESDSTKGAWFILKGDVEYSIPCINTNNQWKTYYLFIETNKTSSLSVSAELWLGYGPGHTTSTSYANDGKDVYSTRGVALFDNVICEKVDESELTSSADASLATYGAYVYDATDSAHDNFVEFKAAIDSSADSRGNKYVKATSAYYLNNASMELRTHVTSYTTNSYRKYFYTFRENYASSNLSDWTLETSETSLDKRYYGSVDLSKLYTETTAEDTSDVSDNYSSLIGSSYNFYAMSYEKWYNDVMNGEVHNLNSADETYAMMIYNKDLQANTIKSSDSIVIDSNSYYAISVYVYVWAKTYDNGTYFADYSGTLPTDPYTGTFTTDEKVLYDIGDGNKIADYFGDLTADETTAASGFDAATLGDYAYSGSLAATYKTNEKAWLNGLMGYDGTATTVSDTLAQSFYYSYLYLNCKDDAAFADLQDALYKGYCSERKTNIASYTSLKKEKDDYADDLEEYNVAKAEYEAKYKIWKDNNTEPYATVKLTGADDGLEKTTTELGEWQKLTFFIRGNQLSSRQLTVEMSLGTGTEYSTYMIGGAFFDNIEVVEYTAAEAAALGEFTTLSEIEDADEVAFGGLYGSGELTSDSEAAQKIVADNWTAAAADGTAAGDADNIGASVSSDKDGLGSIEINGNQYYLYILKYTNAVATASTLAYSGDNALVIDPNKFYRLAFLVRTTDVDEDLGISITLYYGETKDDISTSLDATVTKYTNNDDEWAEVVYYIGGDLLKTYYVGMTVAMGSGTRFSTDSYVKGTVELAAFNCLEIDYDEYNSAATGDKIVSGVSLYNMTYDIDSADVKFTNSYYSKINYEKTDKEEFGADNQLTGVGTTNSWTVTSVIDNDYDTPTDVTVNGDTKKLTWTGSTGVSGTDEIGTVKPAYYEIWYKYTDDDGDSVEKLFDTVDATTANDSYSYDLEQTAGESSDWRLTYFAVKAVGADGVSSLSSYASIGLGTTGKTDIPGTRAAMKKAEATAGTVVVANESSALFGEVNGENYVSPYPTLMKISGNYLASISAYSGSVSLSSDTYYKISVWLYTDVGTYASVTLGGTSGSLQATTDSSQLGFVYITTNGKWEEYCFFVKTGNFDASLYVKLSLGNPYITSKSGKIGTVTDTYYPTTGLSKGNAYFDAVKVTEEDESVYSEAKELDDAYSGTGYASALHQYVYTNINYYIYTMEYVLDSFDAYDASTDDDFGNDPSNYNRSYDTDLSKGSDLATYGIYDATSDSEDMVNAIEYLYKYYDDDSDEDVFVYNDVFSKLFDEKIDCSAWGDAEWKDFMKTFLSVDRKDSDGNVIYDGGDNTLVMSNKAESGYAQNYALDSSYNYTIAAGGYAKLTFSARTLIARIITTETKDTSGNTVKSYSYASDKAFGELRVTPSSSSDDTVSVKINSYVYGDSVYAEVTYSVYVYNVTDADGTMTWAFYLGDEASDDANDVFGQYLIGMMAVDLVSAESVTENEYTAAKAADSDSDTSYFYQYEESTDEDTDTDDDNDGSDTTEENFWEKLVANQYFWLYISSFVIALVIIVTIIAVLVNRWKKKHPKEVVGENIVKTEKDIKVINPEPDVKEDALEFDEYVDEITPVVHNQRKVNKGKKKNKGYKKR